MWRMLVVLRKNLQNIGKSSRVADENMYGGRVNGAAEYVDRRRNSMNGLSIICNVVRAPLSIISCFSQPRVNGVDGVWVSGEFTQTSEINHLMVNDSMRYAILMYDQTFEVWMKCLKWWGFSTTLPNSVQEAYNHIVLGVSEARTRKVWSYLFLTIAWSIWSVCKNTVFRAQEISVEDAFEKDHDRCTFSCTPKPTHCGPTGSSYNGNSKHIAPNRRCVEPCAGSECACSIFHKKITLLTML